MNLYSEMSTETLQMKLKKAYDRISKLKTHGGLWATEHEIKFCVNELEKRGVKIE